MQGVAMVRVLFGAVWKDGKAFLNVVQRFGILPEGIAGDAEIAIKIVFCLYIGFSARP